MRKVIFTSRKVPNNSFFMRGIQVSEELNKLGYNTECIHPDHLSNIKNAIIIFVRRSSHPRKLDKIKENNYLILDPLDRVAEVNDNKNLSYMDGIIFASKFQSEMYPLWNKDRYFIHHHWDPNLNQWSYLHDHFELGYWGYKTSATNLRNLIPHQNQNFQALFNTYPSEEFFRRVSCHYSVKDLQRGLGWRPSTKISTAAAVNCNIIVSRDEISSEILPKDYPFWVENPCFEETKKVIDYARNVYGTSYWNYGLECMSKVKEQTSIAVCAKKYAQIIDEIDKKF